MSQALWSWCVRASVQGSTKRLGDKDSCFVNSLLAEASGHGRVAPAMLGGMDTPGVGSS